MIYNKLFIDEGLYPLLNKTELHDYFEKYKAGDYTARDILIQHNVRLVIYYVVTKFKKTSYDLQELVSVGMIGLIKSVDTFDVSKNILFASYATKCIRNEILMFLRKEKKYLNIDSLNRTLNLDEKEITLEDILCDESVELEYDYEKKELYQRLRKVVNMLPELDRKVMELYFGFLNNKPLKQAEIEKQLGFSQSYISRIISRNLKKIKTILEDESTYESTLEVHNQEPIKPKLTSIFRNYDQYGLEQSTTIYQDEKNQQETEHTVVEKGESASNMSFEKIDQELLQTLKVSNLDQLIATYSTKEAIIIFLKLGYLKRDFDTESIAQFLSVEPHVVREVMKKFLFAYKETIHQVIDIVIQDPLAETSEESKQKGL